MTKIQEYDLIVLGAGPAGLNAALYASRYGLKVKVIGKDMGLIAETPFVENYIGMYPISGFELVSKFSEHVTKLGVEIEYNTITNLTKENKLFIVETTNFKGLKIKNYAKSIVYALGGTKRKLGLDNEQIYAGHGISYCATCDGPFFKNKVVAVTGGANSAVEAAIHLSKVAKKVYIIYRKSKLRAMQSLINVLEKQKNVQVIYNSNIIEVDGQNKLENVTLKDNDGVLTKMDLDGVFVEFGYIPNIDLTKNLNVELKDALINVNSRMETNVDGFFAAGDCTNGNDKFWQVIIACAEGAMAAKSANEYVIGNFAND